MNHLRTNHLITRRMDTNEELVSTCTNGLQAGQITYQVVPWHWYLEDISIWWKWLHLAYTTLLWLEWALTINLSFSAGHSLPWYTITIVAVATPYIFTLTVHTSEVILKLPLVWTPDPSGCTRKGLILKFPLVWTPDPSGHAGKGLILKLPLVWTPDPSGRASSHPVF